MKRQRKAPFDAMEVSLDVGSEINTDLNFEEPSVKNVPCRHISLLDSDEDILDNIQVSFSIWFFLRFDSSKTSNNTIF